MIPKVTLVTPPPAVQKAAFPTESAPYKIWWVLKAEFPAPHGTIFVRYAAPESGVDCLDVLTPTGKRLQRLRDVPLMDKFLPVRLQGRWISPYEKKGPLITFEQRFPDDKENKTLYLAFPDGFNGLCTLSRAYDPRKKHVWDGLSFVEEADRTKTGITAERFSAPELLPPSRQRSMTGFGALMKKDRRYLLRWTSQGEKNFMLEILDKTGRVLARHRLQDDFGATSFTFLSAMWLDEKRRRGPILEVRDSDQVRLQVFSDDFQRLLCVQDFNDGSSSLAATTVAFERDKRGILEVWENYSSSDGDHSSTGYRWTGRAFQEIKK